MRSVKLPSYVRKTIRAHKKKNIASRLKHEDKIRYRKEFQTNNNWKYTNPGPYIKTERARETRIFAEANDLGSITPKEMYRIKAETYLQEIERNERIAVERDRARRAAGRAAFARALRENARTYDPGVENVLEREGLNIDAIEIEPDLNIRRLRYEERALRGPIIRDQLIAEADRRSAEMMERISLRDLERETDDLAQLSRSVLSDITGEGRRKKKKRNKTKGRKKRNKKRKNLTKRQNKRAFY